LKLTKENTMIVDYTPVWKDNSSLLERPLKMKILIILDGHEFLSIPTFGLDQAIKVRDEIIGEEL